ncbi:MAG: biopolymer transporter ExbD [Deltaproteobacteria bacterium]|nr:biopolymer transporter ExbD [Deltaproteobacteria bacterium]
MAFKGVQDDELMAEINIVPLTDVMLVLLIIFMVATPLMMVESMSVKLPEAASGAVVEDSKPLTIRVSEAGEITINGDVVTRDLLLTRLGNELKIFSSDKAVIIEGDNKADYGLIIEVLDTAKRAGAVRLSVATTKAKGGS